MGASNKRDSCERVRARLRVNVQALVETLNRVQVRAGRIPYAAGKVVEQHKERKETTYPSIGPLHMLRGPTPPSICMGNLLTSP